MQQDSQKGVKSFAFIITLFTGIVAFVADVVTIFIYFNIRLTAPLYTEGFPSADFAGTTFSVNTLTAMTGTLGFYSASVMGVAFWNLAHRQPNELGRLISWFSFHGLVFLPITAFWYGTFWAAEFDWLTACLGFPAGFILFELLIGTACWVIAAAVFGWEAQVYDLIVRAKEQVVFAGLIATGLWIIAVVLLANLSTGWWAIIGIFTVLFIIAGVAFYLRYPELIRPLFDLPRLLMDRDVPPLLAIEIRQRIGMIGYITSVELSASHYDIPAHKVRTLLEKYAERYGDEEDLVLITDSYRAYGAMLVPKTPLERLSDEQEYWQRKRLEQHLRTSSSLELRQSAWQIDPDKFLLFDMKSVTDYSKWEDKPALVLTKRAYLEERPWAGKRGKSA